MYSDIINHDTKQCTGQCVYTYIVHAYQQAVLQHICSADNIIKTKLISLGLSNQYACIVILFQTMTLHRTISMHINRATHSNLWVLW